MNDKEFADNIHLIIHSIRLIPNYKSSNAEQKIGKLVREHFTACQECKEINDKIKSNPIKERKGIGKIIKDTLGGGE